MRTLLSCPAAAALLLLLLQATPAAGASCPAGDEDGDSLLSAFEDRDQNGDCDDDDTDSDGLPDYLDPDDDGDGVATLGEQPDGDGDGNPVDARDTDSDGLPDYLDPDDDGDGIPTSDEDANGNGDPTDDDFNGDGVPDYLDSCGQVDSEGDGLLDPFEDVGGNGRCDDDDTDSDGLPDYLDPDDDGDGVATLGEQPDGDGDGNPVDARDTDSDGLPDYLDPDDDGDGIPTSDEDANGNGDPIDDDSDLDGIPDYLDAVFTPGTLSNSDFDTDLDDWDLLADDGQWASLDADGAPDSGSARITETSQLGSGRLAQGVAVEGGSQQRLAGCGLIPSGQGATGVFEIAVLWYEEACNDAPATQLGVDTLGAIGGPLDSWLCGSDEWTAPPAARCGVVSLSVANDAGSGPFSAHFDAISLPEPGARSGLPGGVLLLAFLAGRAARRGSPGSGARPGRSQG